MVIFLIVVPGGNSRVWLKSCPHRTQSGNRQYVLAVGALKGDPKNMEARKNYDKLASSFFDSFKDQATKRAFRTLKTTSKT